MKINENKIKKFTLLAAILAPMIYLFGSLFAGLQGAHGEQIFADGQDNSVISLDNRIIDNSKSNYDVGSVFSVASDSRFFMVDVGVWPSGEYTLDFTYLNVSNPNLRILAVDSSDIIVSALLVYNSPLSFSFGADLHYYLRCDKTYVSSFGFALVSYPASVSAFLSSENYSDYVFKSFFVKNNFLAASGEKVIDGTPEYGFAPAADFIRYVDSNMLHLANLEWGYLVIGYVYYAFHVTIVFLMFELLMFFPHLIENIYEKFERGW